MRDVRARRRARRASGLILRSDPDPPRPVASPYEREKHDRTLAACGPGPFPRALLLGAGNGAFADLLAGVCTSLTAIDASSTVVELARERLARHPHVVVRTGAIPDGLPLEEDFDLVVASEVLTRLPGDAFRRTVDRLPLVLHPGSRLVAVHWAGQGPRQERSAADTHRALGIGTGLRRAELSPPTGTRGYLLDAFDMR